MKGDYNIRSRMASVYIAEENNIKTIVMNDQEIEVKQYLPINDKLDLIATVINLAADDNNFMNPVKTEVFMKLEIAFRYTNISFTDKQKEDLVKLYDLMDSNDLFDVIINEIPENEYNTIVDGVMDCSESIYAYQNSIMGVLERVSTDYDSTNLNLDVLKDKFQDLGDVSLLQEVVTKLG